MPRRRVIITLNDLLSTLLPVQLTCTNCKAVFFPVPSGCPAPLLQMHSLGCQLMLASVKACAFASCYSVGPYVDFIGLFLADSPYSSLKQLNNRCRKKFYKTNCLTQPAKKNLPFILYIRIPTCNLSSTRGCDSCGNKKDVRV